MVSLLLLLLVFVVLALIVTGVPVIFALVSASLAISLVGTLSGTFDPALFGAVPGRIFGLLENRLLQALPLFILAGKLLEHSGLAQVLLAALAGKSGRDTKRMAFVVLIVSLIIAASTGMVGATITMLAAIALPALLASGMSTRSSAGLLCACGSLGQLVPPSIVLILLSDQISNAHLTAQRTAGNFSPEPVTVGHLFAGAIVPGLVLAALYGLYIAASVPKSSAKLSAAGDASRVSNTGNIPGAVAAMLALLFVPVSIITGIATVTEAAAIGAFACLFAALMQENRMMIFRAFREAVEITGMIFGIILAASVFALVMRGLNGDVLFENMLNSLPDAEFWALAIVLLMVFILGFFMEFVEITYIVVPVAAPVLFALGVDPVWFAILMAVNLQISFLTPPLGISLFYYKSVVQIETLELYRAVVPFVLIQIFALALLVAFPALATWLPSFLI